MPALSSRDRISVVVQKPKSVLVNQSGVIAIRRLDDLLDVDTSAKENGSMLVYNEATGQFIATRLLDHQEIDGGLY